MGYLNDGCDRRRRRRRRRRPSFDDGEGADGVLVSWCPCDVTVQFGLFNKAAGANPPLQLLLLAAACLRFGDVGVEEEVDTKLGRGLRRQSHKCTARPSKIYFELHFSMSS